MKIAALILASVQAVMVKEDQGEVDMAVHVATSTFGVEDEWLRIDQIIDHGTDDTNGGHDGGHDGGHTVGGTCQEVHSSYSSYLMEDGTWSDPSHYDECFDGCVRAGGMVEYIMDSTETSTHSYPQCILDETMCPEGFYDTWEYEHWETGEMVTEGWCDHGCFLSGGVMEEQCDTYGEGEEHCWLSCNHGEDNELCAFPYWPSWDDVEQCDTYCAPNGGILDQEGMCLYENIHN